MPALDAELSPAASGPSVREVARASRDRTLILGAAFLVFAALAGILIGELTLSGYTFGIAVLIWFLVPVITWRWPPAGVVMIGGLGLLFEEYLWIACLSTITEAVAVVTISAVSPSCSTTPIENSTTSCGPRASLSG